MSDCANPGDGHAVVPDLGVRLPRELARGCVGSGALALSMGARAEQSPGT